MHYEPSDFEYNGINLARFVDSLDEETRDWLIEFSHCIAGTNAANSLEAETILEDAEQYGIVEELIDCIERGGLNYILRKLNAMATVYFRKQGWDELADSSEWDEFAENWGYTPWNCLCQDVWDKIADMPVEL